MYSLMWLSTCWIPVVYALKYFVNHKEVTGVYGYKNIDDCESKACELSLQDLETTTKYQRMKVYYTMNNKNFAYCALADEFVWPQDDSYQFSWIQKANVVDTSSCDIIDVTESVVLYSGPSHNFYFSKFDFNWIPEVAKHAKTHTELHIYDNNNSVYKINLCSNSCKDPKIENICGVKLYNRFSEDFVNFDQI